MPRKKKATLPPPTQETAPPQQNGGVSASAPEREMVDLSAYLSEIGNRLVTAESMPAPDRQSQAATPMEHRQLIVFRLGQLPYGIEISHVAEVMHRPEITPVPGTPDWVLGVSNVHGEITSVVDLARFFEEPPKTKWQPEYMLVTQAEDQRIALAVDTVDIIYTIPLNQVISPPFKIEPVLVQYLQGAIERSEDFIRLLDCERLLLGSQMQRFG